MDQDILNALVEYINNKVINVLSIWYQYDEKKYEKRKIKKYDIYIILIWPSSPCAYLHLYNNF